MYRSGEEFCFSLRWRVDRITKLQAMLNSHYICFLGWQKPLPWQLPLLDEPQNLCFVWHPSIEQDIWTDYVPAGCGKGPFCRRICSGISRLINSGEAPVNCNKGENECLCTARLIQAKEWEDYKDGGID